MAATDIEWTDESWNCLRGCSRISPGCGSSDGGGCYAEAQAHRFSGPGGPYEGLTRLTKGGPRWTGKIMLVPEKLAEPLSWRKPRLVFVNSMSDLFHEDVPNEYIAAVFGVMAAATRHTFQILTKRSERMRQWFGWSGLHAGGAAWTCWYQANVALRAAGLDLRLPDVDPYMQGPWPLPNVHLGVSVESPDYLHRLDDLLACPAVVRWVSLEPLLAGVDITRWLRRYCGCPQGAEPSPCDGWMGVEGCRNEPPRLSWVVIGGESGNKARPFDLAWPRRIVADCKAAGVPVFVKQLGARPVDGRADCTREWWPAQLVRLHSRKGGDPSEWPEDLRVREWPTS